MRRLLLPIMAIALAGSVHSSFAVDLSAGKDLYSDNCAICHGTNGEGYPASVVPDGAVRIKKLAGDSAYWDFAIFKKAVLTGKDDHDRPMRVMPVFGKTGLFTPEGQMLTDDDLANVQGYLQTLAPKQ